MRVSIVIRTKNEGRYLAGVLEAIARQEHPCREVIVVDSGSTDSTIQIAEAFQARVITIKPQSFTYGYALNRGVKASRGEVVAFLSGHAVPCDESWLGHLVRPFSDERVAGCYGGQLPLPDCRPWERLNLERNFGAMPRVQSHDPFFSNANAAIRRDLWRRIPFREDLPGGEDHAWAASAQAVGYQIVYEPQAAVRHSHDEGLRQLYRRMARERAGLLAAGLGDCYGSYSLIRCLAGSLRAALSDNLALVRAGASPVELLASPLRRLAQGLGAYEAHRAYRRKAEPFMAYSRDRQENCS
jgi:glycosyltransferase involved in cell wall biosynthesis